jgi:hypothetical protein
MIAMLAFLLVVVPPKLKPWIWTYLSGAEIQVYNASDAGCQKAGRKVVAADRGSIFWLCDATERQLTSSSGHGSQAPNGLQIILTSGGRGGASGRWA